MSILISEVFGGGIFSLFHQALETLLDAPNVDKITRFKIKIADHHFIRHKSLFDDFFEDMPEPCDTTMQFLYQSQRRTRFTKIHLHADMPRIKRICQLNPIHPSIVEKVKYYVTQFGINENSLAIHVRMTDMNTVHIRDYGAVTIEHYQKIIDTMLNSYTNIDNIYITSDNTESIHTLHARYSDRYRINYVTDSYRRENENSENCDFQMYAINVIPDFHIKAFVELLIASYCSYFIYRISDYSNFCILYSNTIKVIMDVN